MSRRAALLLLLALGLAAGAWFAIESILRVDRHRPWLEGEVARITGFPVSIEELDLRLLPVPRISVLASQIGSGDASVTAGRVDLIPDLRALLGGRLVLSSVEILDLTLTIPEDGDQIQSVWTQLRERLEAELALARDTPNAETLKVEHFGARGITLKRGAEVIALANLAAHQVASGIEVGLELSLEALKATLAGEALLSDTGSEPHLLATLRILGLRTDALGELPEALRAAVSGTIAIEGNPEQSLKLQLESTLDPDSALGPRGPLTGRIDLRLADAPSLDFTIAADGLDASGSLGPDEDGSLGLRLDTIDARGAALGIAFASWGDSPLRLGGEAANLRATGWEIALPTNASPTLRSGRIAIRDLDVAWDAKRLSTPWHLQAEVVDGALRIDSVGSRAFELSGALHPGTDLDPATLQLGGSVDLEPELLALFSEPNSMPELQGRIVIDEFHTPLPPAPNALLVRAHLRDGSASFSGESYLDSILGIDLDLKGSEGRWELSGRGRSKQLGAVDFSAQREAEASRLSGVLSLDAAKLTGLLPELLDPLLREFGRSRLHFQLDPASAESPEIGIHLDRRDSPRLKAKLSIPTDSDLDWLGNLDAQIQIPAAALRAALPDGLKADGYADLHLERPANAGRFVANLDAAALHLTLAPWLDKVANEPLRVTLRGPAGADAWEAQEIVIAAQGGEARFRPEGEGWLADALALDLAAWSPLLPKGARAEGRVTGSIRTDPFRADLNLSGVGLGPAPDVALASFDGAVSLNGPRSELRSLRIRGPDTDFVLEATVQEGRTTGEIRGASLNFDFLRSWTSAFNALTPEPPATTASGRFGELSGEIDVRLDALHAGRSVAKQLRAKLQLAESGLRIDSLAFDTYEGRVAGSIEIPASEGLKTSLEIRSVTGRFLDDLLFADEPRGIRGVFKGTLHFDAPRGFELRPILASGSGSLNGSARKGSFGRLGLATRLITVLRASEVLRLKLPSIRDEGLVFDTVESELTMKRGQMSVDRFQLESAVYAISASGSVDFAADRTQLPIEFDAIRGLSTILQPIPIAGDALKIAHVRMVATGSPYDMKIGVASFRDQIVGASTALPRATIGRIRDALDLMKPRPDTPPDPKDSKDPQKPELPAPEDAPAPPPPPPLPEANEEPTPLPES